MSEIKDNNIINTEDNTVFVAQSDTTFLDNTFTVPRISLLDNNGRDFIFWGDKGKNNLYPNKLFDLYTNCSLHGSICDSAASQIAGNGFLFDETSKTASKTAKFLDNINVNGEDVNEILDKTAFSLKLYNGFAWFVTWSRDWSEISQIEFCDIFNLRAAKPDATGNIPGWWFSLDWESYRPQRIYIPSFNEKTATMKKEEYKKVLNEFLNNNQNVDKSLLSTKDHTQVFVYKKYKSNSLFYPVPDYSGALSSIEIDIESDVYGISSFKNGFNPDYHIQVPFKGDEKARQELVKSYKKSFTSAKNSGNAVFSTIKDKENASIIDVIPSPGANQKYLSIYENAQQKILSGHRITHPILCGILISGKLGLSNELENAQELYYNTVIQPYQNIISKQFNKLLKINGLDSVSIKPNNPFTSYSNTSGDKATNNDIPVDDNNNNNTDNNTID